MSKEELLEKYKVMNEESKPLRRNACIIIISIAVAMLIVIGMFVDLGLLILLIFMTTLFSFILILLIDSGITAKQNVVYKEYKKLVLEDLKTKENIFTEITNDNPVLNEDIIALFKEINNPEVHFYDFTTVSMNDIFISHSYFIVRDTNSDMPKTVFNGSVLKIDEKRIEEFIYQVNKDNSNKLTDEYSYDPKEYEYEENNNTEQSNINSSTLTIIENLSTILGPKFRCSKLDNHFYIAVPKRLNITREQYVARNRNGTVRKVIVGTIEEYLNTIEFYKSILQCIDNTKKDSIV